MPAIPVTTVPRSASELVSGVSRSIGDALGTYRSERAYLETLGRPGARIADYIFAPSIALEQAHAQLPSSSPAATTLASAIDGIEELRAQWSAQSALMVLARIDREVRTAADLLGA